ncbi:NUDIX domain-containing protein [Hirsutella rhossiliensis]|uniref:NUDIX domain-containing protein n=1 Tax=Hirsutella rhossiliensis TaxID=111463 RepID=A0A9P8SFP6_9HYPO|nr:NUDIX domain-containing protein [Hirsutella rhossiliensis]KAH0959226.1 NUDIX domain-containing protein [Hirsutella rhossiliensis]
MAARIGVSVIIRSTRGEFLVGQRVGGYGAGSWQLPGGYVGAGEGLLAAAVRATKEETGVDVEALWVVDTTYGLLTQESEEYLTFFVYCTIQYVRAVSEANEPEKRVGWVWRSVDELQSLPLFLPLSRLLEHSHNLTESRGLSVRLPPDSVADRPVITIKWDHAARGGWKLDGLRATLTLPARRDVTIVDAAVDANRRLDAVVVVRGSEGQGRQKMAVPFATDLVFSNFKDRHGQGFCDQYLLEAVNTDVEGNYKLWLRY